MVGTAMNAKQRRKLLRQQQRGEAPGSAAEPVKQDDAEPATSDAGSALKVKTEAKTDTVKQEAIEDPPKPAQEETEGDQSGRPLTAKQRRLLKRKSKRQEDGTEHVAQKKKQQAEKKRQRSEDTQSSVEPPSKRKSIHLTLFVGQIPFKATEKMIRQHFEEAGEIQLRMMTDKKTGKFRGTAFIEVKDSKALGAALSRHHTLLCGRRINVEMTASGGGNKSEQRVNKIKLLRQKQSNVQVEKTKALIQKHIDGPEYKLQQEDVDDRMIDFLSWFDYETAKKALEEYNRCVSDRVQNRKAFFMGILKRFRQTDGVE